MNLDFLNTSSHWLSDDGNRWRRLAFEFERRSRIEADVERRVEAGSQRVPGWRRPRRDLDRGRILCQLIKKEWISFATSNFSNRFWYLLVRETVGMPRRHIWDSNCHLERSNRRRSSGPDCPPSFFPFVGFSSAFSSSSRKIQIQFKIENSNCVSRCNDKLSLYENKTETSA